MYLVIEIASTDYRVYVVPMGLIWHMMSIDGIYLVRHMGRKLGQIAYNTYWDVYNMHSCQKSDHGLIH